MFCFFFNFFLYLFVCVWVGWGVCGCGCLFCFVFVYIDDYSLCSIPEKCLDPLQHLTTNAVMIKFRDQLQALMRNLIKGLREIKQFYINLLFVVMTLSQSQVLDGSN